jgi:hypothetical protein
LGSHLIERLLVDGHGVIWISSKVLSE